MPETLRVGILQLSASSNKNESASRLRSLLSTARIEADILVMPEYTMFDPTGLKREQIMEDAEALDGPWVEMLKKIASEYNSFVVGHLFEKTEKKLYNTIIVIDPHEELKAIYRKTHLFDAYGYRESSVFDKGDSLSPIVNIKGFNLAIAVCFELRFPEIFRTYALQGADIIAVPSAWYRGPLKEETLAFLARSRAHENTVYVAVSALYGENFTGRSMVIDPYGVVIVDAGIGQRYVEVEVSKQVIAEARKTLPVLKLRRPNLYM